MMFDLTVSFKGTVPTYHVWRFIDSYRGEFLLRPSPLVRLYSCLLCLSSSGGGDEKERERKQRLWKFRKRKEKHGVEQCLGKHQRNSAQSFPEGGRERLQASGMHAGLRGDVKLSGL